MASVSGGAADKNKVRSLSHTIELEDLKATVEQWIRGGADGAAAPINNGAALAAGVCAVGAAAMALSMFIVLIPATYGVFGWLLYRNRGWQFYQPGVGGRRFVALNAVAWAMYGILVLLQFANLWFRDPLVTFNTYLLGSLSYVLMLIALFSYYPPDGRARGSSLALSTPSADELLNSQHYKTRVFNEELQDSVLMRNEDAAPSFFWWIFIGMQVAMVGTSSVVAVVGSLSDGHLVSRMLTTTFVLWTVACGVSTTHALGGKWRHIKSNYAAFQPGKGGGPYIGLQFAGWVAFSMSMICGLLALYHQFWAYHGALANRRSLLAATGVLGMVSEALIVASLFVFKDNSEPATGKVNVAGEQRMDAAEQSLQARLVHWFVSLQFALLNKVFGPADPENDTRSPVMAVDAFRGCEDKWKRVTKHCTHTGDRYLVIGCGFVGRRLVNRLLERGETDVRVFDIAPCDFWPGDKRVQFIRGDVTKFEQINKACEGVHTIYATFAIIRFMERLAHQAFISYHINVTGTETLLEACKAQSCKRLIVTSSSHATTDEHSEPRFNRDETAKLLSRADAHNHYGWTKAIADELAIKADGMRLASGGELEVTVVRPCSGVFGADDKLSFEKVMTMTVAPGVGANALMDWVYVENVVLGHILAEAALQQGRPGVRGEAFCISNDDPVNMQDFFMLTKKIIRNLPDVKMRKALPLAFLWIPMAPLWVIAYISELNQLVFKGKVSLGRDVDMLTPPMLSTATMEYTYTSGKARKVLGYEPVYLLEEAIQISLHEFYGARHGKKTN